MALPGSLLADDMGLGKTLQCACLLQYLRDQGHISKAKPALVVVPFSVMRNWRSELQRWTPSLRARLYHGKHRSFAGLSWIFNGFSWIFHGFSWMFMVLAAVSHSESSETKMCVVTGDAEVLITTYAVLQLDHQKFCEGQK